MPDDKTDINNERQTLVEGNEEPLDNVTKPFNALVKKEQRAVFLERLQPKLIPTVLAGGALLSTGFIGAWHVLPPAAKMAGALSMAAVAAFGPLLVNRKKQTIPDRKEALVNIDERSGEAQKAPAQSLDEKLSGNSSQTDRTLRNKQINKLWDDWGSRLKPGKAKPHIPFLLAAAVMVSSSLTTGYIAGEERMDNLLAAFDWSTPVPVLRVKAWIDPPKDMGLDIPPPLTEKTKDHTQGGKKLSAHEGSSITLHIYDQKTTVRVNGETLEPADTLKVKKGEDVLTTYQYEFDIDEEDAVVTIQGGPTWHIVTTPDHAPVTSIDDVKHNQENKNILEVIYSSKDDFGLREGELILEPIDDDESSEPLDAAKLPKLSL